MEMVVEKIEEIGSHKNNLIDIFQWVKKYMKLLIVVAKTAVVALTCRN